MRYERGEVGADLKIPGLTDAQSAKVRNCALIPASDYAGLTKEWKIDCAGTYSESGQFLIREIMMHETARAFGIGHPAKRQGDRDFRAFLG